MRLIDVFCHFQRFIKWGKSSSVLNQNQGEVIKINFCLESDLNGELIFNNDLEQNGKWKRSDCQWNGYEIYRIFDTQWVNLEQKVTKFGKFGRALKKNTPVSEI